MGKALCFQSSGLTVGYCSCVQGTCPLQAAHGQDRQHRLPARGSRREFEICAHARQGCERAGERAKLCWFGDEAQTGNPLGFSDNASYFTGPSLSRRLGSINRAVLALVYPLLMQNRQILPLSRSLYGEDSIWSNVGWTITYPMSSPCKRDLRTGAGVSQRAQQLSTTQGPY